jgi:hypothetical protein
MAQMIERMTLPAVATALGMTAAAFAGRHKTTSRRAGSGGVPIKGADELPAVGRGDKAQSRRWSHPNGR